MNFTRNFTSTSINYNASTTISFDDMKEMFYQNLISPNWTIDSLYLYSMIPIGFISLILNILTFILLLITKIQKTSLNKYLRVHVFASTIQCSILFLSCFSRIPRYTSFSYSYPSRIITCHLLPFSNSLHLFLNLLNIVILFDRLSKFVIRFKKFRNKSPYEFSYQLFVISVLINMGINFYLATKSEDEFVRDMNDVKKLKTMSLCYVTQFGESLVGKLIITSELVISSILVLIVELITSFISIFYFRRYVQNKLSFINLESNKNRMQFSFTETHEVYELSISNYVDNNRMNGSLIYELNTNLTRMTIFFSLFSIISNLICIIFYFISAFDDIEDIIPYGLYSFYLVFFIKYGSNFFFLILFNKNFRRAFRN